MDRVSRRTFLIGVGAAAATTAVGVAYSSESGASPGTTAGTGPAVAGGPNVGPPSSALGVPLDRIEGILKVTGRAPYAYEHEVAHPAYLYPLEATIAAGRITGIDASLATAEPGVLAILSHLDAPKLVADVDAELWILQSDRVFSRGQVIGCVVAESIEVARHAAGLVRVDYEPGPHDTVLTRDRSDLYRPAGLNAGFPTDTAQGDVDTAMASAAATVDATYATPMSFHNPMEPHATIATWTGDELVVYASSQGPHFLAGTLASMFGLDQHQVRVISPHVGGAFGSKLVAHPDVILAALAAQRLAGRPVKLALTRQQMFSQVGYRTPTIQRVRLAADARGRLRGIAHDAVGQTARIKEFAEQTAVCTRTMYAAPNRLTTHRLAALDVGVPTAMRAPGEAPGMYALESAIDELAIAAGIDPIELRLRNEPTTDPESGKPFSSRNLVACLTDGAKRFGWKPRDPKPRRRTEQGWLVGTGMAASTYPVFFVPGSLATIRVEPARLDARRKPTRARYTVRIGASDAGTGARTVLTQIAAHELQVPVEAVHVEIGDTAQPNASFAGGSSGTGSWGPAIVEAARMLRAELDSTHQGLVPAEGLEVTNAPTPFPDMASYAMHSFGAQFAEVRVNEDTGEVRVPRLVGVFAAGRIINPKTARSQMLGGMTMGLSMALHEDAVVDPRYGHVVNHDLAGYHIATNADVGAIEIAWIAEEDPHVNPLGTKGVGELGIVGTAAAIANAVHHATGIRVRDLPITPDKLIGDGPQM